MTKQEMKRYEEQISENLFYAFTKAANTPGVCCRAYIDEDGRTGVEEHADPYGGYLPNRNYLYEAYFLEYPSEAIEEDFEIDTAQIIDDYFLGLEEMESLM